MGPPDGVATHGDVLDGNAVRVHGAARPAGYRLDQSPSARSHDHAPSPADVRGLRLRVVDEDRHQRSAAHRRVDLEVARLALVRVRACQHTRRPLSRRASLVAPRWSSSDGSRSQIWIPSIAFALLLRSTIPNCSFCCPDLDFTY